MDTTPDTKTNGAAAAVASPPPPSTAPVTYKVLALADVGASGNYRRTIDDADLSELAASVKARGVEVAIKVHPAPAGAKYKHEIIYGERRWRAAHRAGLTTIPALVVDRRLTDAEVREERLVENQHRADVAPLEEAECFHDMIAEDGHTPETIGERIGKSPSYVRARMKLLDLPVNGRKALKDGKLPLSHALSIVQRVHSPKLQDEAIAKALAGTRRWDGLTGKETVDPMSHRDLLQMLRQQFMTELRLAPFDPKDAELVPAAGACVGCPKRTGNQPELFSDVKSPDVCTDTECFGKKKSAAWDRAAAAATRDGKKVLGDDATRRLFAGGTHVLSGASHVDLKDDLPYELQQSSGKKTWGQLAGKDLPVPILVKDGASNPRELYDREKIVDLAKAAGKIAKRGAASGPRSSSSSPGQKKQAAALDLKRRTARAALEQIAEGAAKKDPGLSFWKWLATATVPGAGNDAKHHVATRREIRGTGPRGAEGGALLALVDGMRTAGELRGLVAELLAAEDCAPTHTSPGARFTSACSLFDVDTKKLAAAVAAEQKAGKAAKPSKRAKAKGSKS